MGRRRARIGVLGGTFDHLHAGHRRLLAAAFQAADRVGIGVTTEAYLRAHPKVASRRVQPYSTRRSRLLRYLRAHYPSARWWVVPLEDGVGGALQPEVQILVASADTRDGARRVNAERRRRGLPALRLAFVPIAMADDLLPLSSTRIRLGSVDAEGRRRRPVRIAYVRSLPPPVRDRLKQVMRGLFPPGVPLQWVPRPVPRLTRGPPSRRAQAQAVAIRADADWAIGVVPSRASGGKPVEPWVEIAGPTGPLSTGASTVRRHRTVIGQLRAQLAPRRRGWVGRGWSPRPRG